MNGRLINLLLLLLLTYSLLVTSYIHFYKRFLMIGEGIQQIHHAKYWRTFYNFHILFKSGYNYHDFEILNPHLFTYLIWDVFCILSFLFSQSISTCIIKYLFWLQINRLISVFSLQFSKSNTWYHFFCSKYGIEIHTVHFNIYAI